MSGGFSFVKCDVLLSYYYVIYRYFTYKKVSAVKSVNVPVPMLVMRLLAIDLSVLGEHNKIL